jgi:hypothetical protein
MLYFALFLALFFFCDAIKACNNILQFPLFFNKGFVLMFMLDKQIICILNK